MTEERRAYSLDPFEQWPWMRRAACHGEEVNTFFPERGAETETAQAICAGCPVREECLEYGLSERFGIYGGLGEKQRRALRQRRRQERAS